MTDLENTHPCDLNLLHHVDAAIRDLFMLDRPLFQRCFDGRSQMAWSFTKQKMKLAKAFTYNLWVQNCWHIVFDHNLDQLKFPLVPYTMTMFAGQTKSLSDFLRGR